MEPYIFLTANNAIPFTLKTEGVSGTYYEKWNFWHVSIAEINYTL